MICCEVRRARIGTKFDALELVNSLIKWCPYGFKMQFHLLWMVVISVIVTLGVHSDSHVYIPEPIAIVSSLILMFLFVLRFKQAQDYDVDRLAEMIAEHPWVSEFNIPSRSGKRLSCLNVLFIHGTMIYKAQKKIKAIDEGASLRRERKLLSGLSNES